MFELHLWLTKKNYVLYVYVNINVSIQDIKIKINKPVYFWEKIMMYFQFPNIREFKLQH